MSQTFNVVKCFQCEMFQVDIDKKSTQKWTCKMCGSKQSLKQVYFQGESKDCREHVKSLNEQKFHLDEFKGRQMVELVQGREQTVSNTSPKRPAKSRWAKYLVNEDDNED